MAELIKPIKDITELVENAYGLNTVIARDFTEEQQEKLAITVKKLMEDEMITVMSWMKEEEKMKMEIERG